MRSFIELLRKNRRPRLALGVRRVTTASKGMGMDGRAFALVCERSVLILIRLVSKEIVGHTRVYLGMGLRRSDWGVSVSSGVQNG